MSTNPVVKIARSCESSPEQLTAVCGHSEAVDRLLARNPRASPELLDKLSRSRDKTTREHVAVHPNASKAVVLALARQFPGAFFKNPAFDWLLLEDPDLLFEVGNGLLKNILRRADCPVSFMTWAVVHGDPQQKLAVAMNAESPEGLLRKLVAQGDKAGEAASGHLKLTIAGERVDLEEAFEDCVKTSLGELSSRESASVWRRGLIGPAQWLALKLDARLAVVGTCSLSDLVDGAAPHCAQFLARHADCAVRRLIAKSAHTHPDVLRALASDSDPWVRSAVAGNASTAASIRIELMEVLAKDDWDALRVEVAKSALTHASLLDQLAGDSEQEVLEAVARNLASSPSALERLSRSKKQDVREAVAGNSSTSPEALAMLAKDKLEEIREAVASNPSTPSVMLCELAKDRKIGVRQEAAGNASTPAHVLTQLFEADGLGLMGFDLAHNTAAASLQAASLEALASSDLRSFRRAAAEIAACPAQALERLGKDVESSIRLCVAGNPSASTELLKRLCKDRSKVVRDRAISRLSGLEQLPAGEGVQKALRWQSALRNSAKRFSWKAADPSLGEMSAEALIAMYMQECVDMLLDPAASVVARLMGADGSDVLRIPAERARSAARCSARAVRLLGLCHDKADRADLVKFHRSTDWAERLAVARNTAAPSGLIDALTKDGHRLVALQAETTRCLKVEAAGSLREPV